MRDLAELQIEELGPVAQVEIVAAAQVLNARGAKNGDRVAIIQHPGGLVKQVALHNNLVTYADANRVQYLTDTLPGSSGAPVFDTKWRAVALHHAGGDLQLPGTKQMVYRNQGIAIGLVRQRMTGAGVSV